MDFRTILSPASQRETKKNNDRMLDFQNLDEKGKAAKLLEQKRLLVEAGRIRGDLDHAGNDWALAQLITSIAVRLDPEVELLDNEAPYDYGDDQRLLYNAEIALTHCEFSGDDGAKEAALYLMPSMIHQGAICCALDAIVPGSYPDRAEVDKREPLPGTYLIGRDGSDGRDVCILYLEDHSKAEEMFCAICKHYGDEELTDEEQALANRVRKIWRTRRFSQFELQNFDGEVLHHHDVRVTEIEGPEL